jgi:DNA-binding CsgD family transcriptional regulator
VIERERELTHRPHGQGPTSVVVDKRVLGVTMLDRELMSTDRTRRTIAQMLTMLRAAVPAASVSAAPVAPDGSHNGPSIVFRGAQLRVSPQQVRSEYLARYERDDPFHGRVVVGTNQIIRGTHEHPGYLKQCSNPFLEYAQELDLPHFVRVYLRVDLQLAGYLFLARTGGQRPFSERELTFLERAQPFLESAYVAAVNPAPLAEAETLLSGAGLTRREADVARYAATGMRARDIAERLVLSEPTVKTHLARIYSKLGVQGKAELAARLRPSDG